MTWCWRATSPRRWSSRVPLALSLVGCGNISDIYVTKAKLFRDLAMVASPISARKLLLRRPRSYGLRSMSVDGLIAANDIDLSSTSPSQPPTPKCRSPQSLLANTSIARSHSPSRLPIA